MNVLIVSPCGLPVPAVKGGAVGTLIEELIIENEKQKKMNLTIIGIHDEEAVKKSKEYTDTEFIFLKRKKIISIVDTMIDYILSKLKGRSLKKNRYLWKISVIFCVKKILKKGNFDKIVYQNAGFLLNTLKSRRIRAKYKDNIYYHLHNDIPDNVYYKGVKSSKLLLVSQYLLKKLKIMFGESIEKKAYVLKNGFDCQHFNQLLIEEEQKQLREELNIKEYQKIVLFVGRLDKTKGIEELLQAIEQLDKKDVVLLIVGAHNFGIKDKSEYERKLKESFLKNESCIRFTGYVPYSEIWKYYKIASLVVLPSMWEEPAGLTMLEACAAGIPLITTYSGGIPEYINKEWCILLEKNENITDSIEKYILEILENYITWKEKAISAQEYVFSNFCVEHFYQRFLEGIELN